MWRQNWSVAARHTWGSNRTEGGVPLAIANATAAQRHTVQQRNTVADHCSLADHLDINEDRIEAGLQQPESMTWSAGGIQDSRHHEPELSSCAAAMSCLVMHELKCPAVRCNEHVRTLPISLTDSMPLQCTIACWDAVRR